MWMKGTDEELGSMEGIGDSDSMVYQLVRVKDDGRFVPATDDELMDVEQLLADDESKQQSIESIWHDDSYFSREHVFPKKFLSEGPVQTESNEDSKKLNTRFEEERLRVSDRLFSHSSSYMAIDVQTCNIFNNTKACYDNLRPDAILRETATSSVLLNVSQNTQAGRAEICTEPRTEAVASKASVSETCTSLDSDLCILKRDICLDNLLIRELQEVFKAIFGRQTNVKDKVWLKRRITMGLTNSTNVTSTNVVLRGNKISYKEVTVQTPPGTGAFKSEDVSLSLDEMNNLKNTSSQGLQFNLTGLFTSSREILEKPKTENDMNDVDDQMKHHPTKRMRKPTRRYIEEPSEFQITECNAKVHSSTESPGQHLSCKTYQTRSFCLVDTRGRSFSTRYDSVGGFGMLVPYVYRIRRSRPRKDFMPLMKHHPIQIASNHAGTAYSSVSQYDDVGSVRIARKNMSLPVFLQHPSFKGEKGSMDSLKPSKEKQDAEIEESDSCGVNTDHTQPEIKGTVKRKHHRPWTLSEVLRLVEGVARYGPGKWSEIRQLAFTSYSYRTSVDLKDKWRNLVRASLLQSPIHKGANNINNRTSIPLSPAILCRVRELAELHQQTGIALRPKKPASNRGKSAENESGFL